jgi:hypothetical protein
MGVSCKFFWVWNVIIGARFKKWEMKCFFWNEICLGVMGGVYSALCVS